MKILHLIPGLTQERGGTSAVVEALVRHQASSGHRVGVLTTDQGLRNGESLVKLAESVSCYVAKARGPDRLAYVPEFSITARAHLKDCDVVHVHSFFTYPVLAILREALAAGVPAVVCPHGNLHRFSMGYSPIRKRLYLALYGKAVRRACAAWHFTSENEAKESWPWDSSPRFILPNGLEPSDYAIDRNEARQTVGHLLPQLGDSAYVLFLGRLHAKKRLDLLLQAFLKFAPRDVKLVVAGPDQAGLWRSLAEQFLANSDTNKRVLRVGLVGGAAKTALLAGASLFALSSEHENFGIAPLEALAAGTRVLLSPHIDLAQDVQKANLGDSVPLDTDEWGRKLAQLLKTPEGDQDFAKRARGWVKENYSWKHICVKLLQNYEWVIAGCSPGGHPERLKGAAF